MSVLSIDRCHQLILDQHHISLFGNRKQVGEEEGQWQKALFKGAVDFLGANLSGKWWLVDAPFPLPSLGHID